MDGHQKESRPLPHAHPLMFIKAAQLMSSYNGADNVDWLVDFVLDFGAEEVFVEPVNERAKNLILTEDALRAAGFWTEADAAGAVRHKVGWSPYTARLLRSVQDALKKRSSLHKLRFLLYPTKLTVSYHSGSVCVTQHSRPRP